jgi:hypothetical protein
MIPQRTHERQHSLRCASRAELVFLCVLLRPSVFAVNRALSCQIDCHQPVHRLASASDSPPKVFLSRHIGGDFFSLKAKYKAHERKGRLQSAKQAVVSSNWGWSLRLPAWWRVSLPQAGGGLFRPYYHSILSTITQRFQK